MFNTDFFSIIIVIGLVGISYFIAIKPLCRIYKNLTISIKNTIKRLENYKLSDGDNIRFFDEKFEQESLLSKAWNKYKLNLIKDYTNSNLSASNYFNKSNLTNLTLKNKDLIKVLPALLTSAGLFFSFCFILIGLKGIDPNNIETINDLVSSLSGKFLTSIFGLGCSIWIIVQDKLEGEKLKNICYDLSSELDAIFPVITVQDTLCDIEKHLKSQSEIMNKWSVSIQENSCDAMSKMVESFKIVMESQTTEYFGHLCQSINKASENLEIITNVQENFISNLKEINNASEKSLERQQKIVEELENAVSMIYNEMEELRQMVKYDRDYIDELESISTSLSETCAKTNVTNVNIDKLSSSVSDIATSIENSKKIFIEMQDKMSINSFKVILDEFRNNITVTLNDIHSNLTDYSDGYDSMLNHLTEEVNSTIEKINEAMKDYSSVTNDYLHQYDESIKKAFSYLQQNVESMKDNYSGLENNIDKININVNSLNNSLKDNLKNLDSNFIKLNETIKNTTQKINEENVNA